MANTQPSTTPARYAVAWLTSRTFGFALSAADGLLSYHGFIATGNDVVPSIVMAIVIVAFQCSVAMALISGQNVIAQYQSRFTGGVGPIGFIRRGFGIFVLLIIAALYAIDVATNFQFFNPQLSQTITGFNGWFNTCVNALMAVVFSLGDEIAHVFGDILASGHASNNSAWKTRQ